MPMQKKAPIGGSCNFSNGHNGAHFVHSDCCDTTATCNYTTFCSVAASGAEMVEKALSTSSLTSAV